MAELIKQITITVDTKKGTISIEGLEKKFKDTTLAAEALQKQIDKNTGKFGRTENVIKKEIQLRTQLRAATAGDTAEYQKQSIAIIQLENELKGLTDTQELVAKSANNMRDKTGLAGATAVELGRTISDANYGFTAMANNISQLATLMTTLIATSGGLKGGLNELGKVLRGPIGIIVIFQIVIAVFEKLAMKSKEAKESVDALKNTFGEAAVEISAYTSILQDSNLPLEEKNKIVKELNENHKELNIEIDEEGRLTEDSAEKTERYIKVLQKKARAQFYVTQLEKKFTEILALENQEIGDNLSLVEKGLAVFFSDWYAEDGIRTASLNKTSKQINELTEDIAELNKKITEEGIFASDDESLDKGAKYIQSRIKEYRQRLLDISKEEERFRQLGIQSESIYEQDKIRIKADAAIDALEIKQQEFVKDEELRLKNFNKQSKEDEEREVKKAQKTGGSVAAVRERFRKQRQEAQELSNEAIKKSEQDLANATIVIATSMFQQLDNLYKESERVAKLRREQLMRDESEAVLSFNVSMATNELDRIMYEEELAKTRHKNTIDRLNEEIEQRKKDGKAYLDLVTEKENADAQYERTKTKLTKDGEDARLSIINFAANAAIAIAGKGSALGKSIAIAMAIINTKKAITEAIGDKEVPGFFRILHATAIGAFGFKQVQDIINTKLPVKDTSGTGGAAGSTTIETAAPDFNVVGIGQASQLGQVIGSQFGQPIRAYVVSSDVNTGQALERNITGNAKLD